jgi:hypothetical protein
MDRKHAVEQLEIAKQAVVGCEQMLASQRHLVMARKALGREVEIADRLLTLLEKVYDARVATWDALLAENAPRSHRKKAS